MLNLSHSTIKLYLAAVRFHYRVPNPLCSATDTCVRLQTVMRGIQKQKCTKEKRRPITYSVLVQIHNLKRRMFGVFNDTMLQAACSTAFFAYLRCGEFTINNAKQDNILRTEDMVMDTEETAFTLILRRSKTDPFRKGIQIRLFQSGQTVCPVQCMNRTCPRTFLTTLV